MVHHWIRREEKKMKRDKLNRVDTCDKDAWLQRTTMEKKRRKSTVVRRESCCRIIQSRHNIKQCKCKCFFSCFSLHAGVSLDKVQMHAVFMLALMLVSLSYLSYDISM